MSWKRPPAPPGEERQQKPEKPWRLADIHRIKSPRAGSQRPRSAMGLGYFQASTSPACGDIFHPPTCSWLARPSFLLHPRGRQQRDWRSPIPVPSPPPATHSHLPSLSFLICEVDTLLPPPRQVPGLNSCVQQKMGWCLPSSSLWCSFLPCWTCALRLFVTIMECSPPGSSVHGDSPGKNTRMGFYALLQGIFPTQGSNPHLLCLLH